MLCWFQYSLNDGANWMYVTSPVIVTGRSAGILLLSYVLMRRLLELVLNHFGDYHENRLL
jgi:hypothetical protein